MSAPYSGTSRSITETKCSSLGYDKGQGGSLPPLCSNHKSSVLSCAILCLHSRVSAITTALSSLCPLHSISHSMTSYICLSFSPPLLFESYNRRIDAAQ